MSVFENGEFSPQLVNVDSNIESGAERAPEHQLFGTRFSKRVDYFAFPRTGSHYLSYLLTGVMDLVFFKIAGQDAPEVASRVHELKADVLYSLKLREDGVPFQPVYLRHAPLGIHEKPQLKDDLMIVLVRDPRAAIFSWYRLHVDRLQVRIEDPISWLQCEFDRYRDFYQSAASVALEQPTRVLMVRFEDLVRSPDSLREICRFVDVQPKLDPGFVHRILRFDNVVRSDIARTFYRSGTESGWNSDSQFSKWLEEIDVPHVPEFGY